MMSPRIPLDLLTYARRARRMRAPGAALLAACAATAVVATAATPFAGAATSSDERVASQAWSPFFEQLRPVAAVDARRVVVRFEDPSLGQWIGAGERALGAKQREAWIKRATTLQQKRIDALTAAGVQFTIEHRYVRVMNGVSLMVHGDGAQLLRGVAGVADVTPVRTLWPTAGAGSASAKPATDDGAAGAAAAAGTEAPKTSGGAVRVAVLDTGIDADHPAVGGRVGTGHDATRPDGGKGSVQADAHGTAVAGMVLRGAGDAAGDVQLLPVQVLSLRPARDGVEAVFGESDDLVAGLEHAVDPNGDGSSADGADVAIVASTAPYAGFAGSPEDHAVQAADALGTVVVAAAGNDGASGDAVGTIGSVAASEAALAIGAADLRGRTPAVDVRVHGGAIDETFSDAPLLTADTDAELPTGKLRVAVVEAGGGDVVDYLDSELQSRVSGSVALVAGREGVTVAQQVRAAADAGAIAMLVASDGAGAAAGTIDAGGADIPAVGISRRAGRDLRDAIRGGERLAVTLDATSEKNPAFGTVAGFSSGGARLDGAGRPDLVAPGVGMHVAAEGTGYRTATGTSVAAAWAAGQVAALRAARPDWNAAAIRAALVQGALPLGEDGDRPSLATQGAGLIDAARAQRATGLARIARIDFGTVAPGSSARRDLGVDVSGLKVLLDDGGHDADVKPALASGDQLVLDVDADAKAGHVGGWLVLPVQGIRIPWSATVGDAAAATVPIKAELTNAVLKPVAGPGAFASTLTLKVGGDTGAGGLGIAALQKLEIRLVDAAGKDRGAVGGLEQALPGVYTFGLTGVDAAGKRLKAGDWKLQVRYVPAADPDGEWRDGPASQITVKAAKRAR